MRDPHQQRVNQELRHPRQGRLPFEQLLQSNRAATRDPHIRDATVNPVSEIEWARIRRRNREAGTE